jgi:lycopene cyclase domain-containing protein
MPVYLIYLLIFFVIPVLVLAWLLREVIGKYQRTIAWSLFFIYTIGFVWDWLCVATGVWRYDSAETLGIWFAGLAVEEFVGFYIFGTLLIVGVVLLFLRKANHV